MDERFERDKESLAFYQRFLPGGDKTGPDYGTTPDELRRDRMTTGIFRPFCPWGAGLVIEPPGAMAGERWPGRGW